MSSYLGFDNPANGVFDADNEFKDAGLVAASAAAQVDSADRVVPVGQGFFRADMLVDISAIEVDTGDERYDVLIQGSDTEDFSGDIAVLAQQQYGHASALNGNVTTLTGRYRIPFTNMKGAVKYPYIRVYTLVAGTIATGINYTAYAVEALP